MIIRPLLAIIFIVAIYLLLRWFRNVPSQKISKSLKTMALYLGIGLIIFLAISGRLHWLVAILASILPFIRRLLPLLRYVPLISYWVKRYQAQQPVQEPASGQTSRVESRFVRMTLDHDSGQIDGLILEGRQRDKNLSQLSLEQLLECWRQWSPQDQESVRLLEAFLDQSQGPQWREHIEATDQQTASQDNAAMSENEALAILGLEPSASQDAIIHSHRQLISKLHPDRGGSSFLAAKVNLAKDLLLKHKPDKQADN